MTLTPYGVDLGVLGQQGGRPLRLGQLAGQLRRLAHRDDLQPEGTGALPMRGEDEGHAHAWSVVGSKKKILRYVQRGYLFLYWLGLIDN